MMRPSNVMSALSSAQVNTVLANMVKTVYLEDLFQPRYEMHVVVNFYDYIISQLSDFLTGDIYRTRKRDDYSRCLKVLESYLKNTALKELTEYHTSFINVLNYFINDFSLVMLNFGLVRQGCTPQFILSLPKILCDGMQIEEVEKESHRNRNFVLYSNALLQKYGSLIDNRDSVEGFNLGQEFERLFLKDSEKLKISFREVVEGLEDDSARSSIIRGMFYRRLSVSGIRGIVMEGL